MNYYSEVEEEFTTLTDKPINVLAIFMKYFSYWKFFLFSIILFIIIAVVYVSTTLPKYKVTTSILFHDDQKGGTSEMNVFREMGAVKRRNNADNEVEILKKSLITEKVVRKLDIYFTYMEMKPFGFVENTGLEKYFPRFPKRKVAILYGDELPFQLKAPNEVLDKISSKIDFDVRINLSGAYEFSGTYNMVNYQTIAIATDTIVSLPFGRLYLTKGNTPTPYNMLLRVTLQNPLAVADGYLNSLEVELTSKTSSVADLSLVCMNGNLGRAFLKEYIESYNEQGINEQLQMAEKTSILIDNHLAKLSEELSDVESLAQDYKQSQGLTDIASQADLYNAQMANVGQKKMEVETQYAIVTGLHNYVQKKNNHDQLIPANSGIISPVLNTQINTYNSLVLERNRLARIASSSNQSMIDLNSQIESTFNSVSNGLQNEKNNLEIQQHEINEKYYQNNAKIRAIPRQERVYTDIIRQQNIKEDLFLYLLQKKEERYMNMTTVVPSSKFIDNIRLRGIVWPKKMLILMMCFCIGLILPVLLIKFRDFLRFRISTKEELEEIASVPVLGEIPKATQTQTIAVKGDGNDCFNEMMRLLRANLLFVLDSKEKKVINMLSSISGEGKSFVTVNLAMSLALLEKKVLIIELDIRKPKLAKEFGLSNKEGITLYLSGYLDKKELVRPSGVHEYLSIITAGAIPPNPNELLAKPLLDDLVNELRAEYDFIIIDTPPVGMVSDSFLLDRLTDVNLFITRAGYTPRTYITEAGRYFKDKKLKKMYFILNSVSLNSTEYRYGIGKRYRYGYA